MENVTVNGTYSAASVAGKNSEKATRKIRERHKAVTK